MVEKVEELGPELRARPLADLRILDDRKIHVVEARPDDHVSAQAAEARDRLKDGGIEPTVYVADDVNLHDHSLRAERVVVERLRERIGGVELQAARKSLIRRQPQRVVTRGACALDLRNGAERRARQYR